MKLRGLAGAALAAVVLASCTHSDLPARSPEVYRQCNERVGPLLASLEDLRARLARRITEHNYEIAMRDVQLHYRAFDPRTVDEECLRLVAIDAEEAYRLYVEALDRWSACKVDRYCRPGNLQALLELHWVTASKQLDQAVAGMQALRP